MAPEIDEKNGENGTIVARVNRVISDGPTALTDAAMAKLREDLRVATEMIRSEYHERTGRRLANLGPRDVLTVWVEAMQGIPDYFKNPGDWLIVHTVIPEIMSPPMSLPLMRELRRDTTLISN